MNDNVRCRACGRGPSLTERLRRRLRGWMGWTTWTPVCRHEVFFTCPECERKVSGVVKCRVCGQEEFYT